MRLEQHISKTFSRLDVASVKILAYTTYKRVENTYHFNTHMPGHFKWDLFEFEDISRLYYATSYFQWEVLFLVQSASLIRNFVYYFENFTTSTKLMQYFIVTFMPYLSQASTKRSLSACRTSALLAIRTVWSSYRRLLIFSPLIDPLIFR